MANHYFFFSYLKAELLSRTWQTCVQLFTEKLDLDLSQNSQRFLVRNAKPLKQFFKLLF